eukprot:7220372-Pyramimonas_sp.AAC.1
MDKPRPRNTSRNTDQDGSLEGPRDLCREGSGQGGRRKPLAQGKETGRGTKTPDVMHFSWR